MSLTIVVTNYLRPANVKRLIDAIRAQTVEATIYVWDNSPAQDFDDPRVDWLIRSSKNARCTARWWMASHAATEFVLVHDDDLVPSHPKVLAWTLDAAARNAPFALGASGVILKRNAGYWQSRHVGIRAHSIRHDMRVDIVKGFYFCTPLIQLTKIGYLDLDGEDDIAVSAKLGGGAARPHLVVAKLRSSFDLLQEEGARKLRRTHRAARETARRQFFRRV
jgi:Glycosyl transferase family 2